MTSMAAARGAGRDARCVPAVVDEDARVVLAMLRAALEECGWTQEALAAHLKPVRTADRRYVAKMLAGDKPVTLRDLVALPVDVTAAFLRRWLVAAGHVVVTPVSLDEGAHHLAIGLYSLLTRPTLPARTAGQVKAGLRPTLAVAAPAAAGDPP